MKPKILITESIHECIIPMLEEIGYEIHHKPKIDRQGILDTLNDYTGIIIRSKTPADKELISAGNNLKFLARSGAGMDQVDLEYAESRNITLLNAPEGNRDAVAEHVLGLILNLINKMRNADIQVRKKIWDREGNRGVELMHRTFGIIGFGNMGEAVSKRLSGFGCKIIAYDKYKKGFANEYVEEVTLEDFFEKADIVSFHVPLTPETKFYVNDEFIKSFKKNIILLNTARGEILPLKTLIKYLKSGKILAAGLDVLENEKMGKLTQEQNHQLVELFEMDNVLLTPHVGGWTVESYIKISQTLAKKIKDLKLVGE
ncbi:MAG: phosphoglycerate dehydrogenase [Cyclobacteriaceae bacterium]|nr:phosphoglycerate dehydrogenase [Cyclobacteriaceae bacterium]